MKTFWFLVAVFCTILFSCQREITDTIVNNSNDVISKENQRLSSKITKQTTECWLNGYILNEQMQPVAGAVVECGGKTATTDPKGFFFFTEKLRVNRDYAVIKVIKQGFLNGFRTFTPNRQTTSYHSEKIVLQASNLTAIVPSGGGEVTIDNIKLSFPANAVIRPGGTVYNGDIRVTARYINPSVSVFPYMVPGMLSGLNDAGEIKSLQSLGMANVELRDATGARLEIAAGKTVRLTMPAPAGAPSTIPLWHFNEQYGIWIQQGNARIENNFYVAEINHFSIWNLDIEFNSFELNLVFQSPAQLPIPNLRVDVYRPNQSFVKGFYTDNNGSATLINCSSSETLTLKIAYPCDTLLYVLPPVTQSRTDIITVNSPAIQSYQFNGTLYSCNNQALTNQPFQLYLNNSNSLVVLNGITDAQGRINSATVIPNCVGNALTAQTVSFINNRFYFSSITQVQPGINNYNATLCDSTGNGTTFNDSDIVNIPDPSLQQFVRTQINKPTGNIYYADVKSLKTIRAYSIPQVNSLLGLQYFTSLDTLEISPINGVVHNFTDLNPIGSLTTLRYLNLSRGSLTDISPIQNLVSLTELYLTENQISNITALQPLQQLKTLWLTRNPLQQVNSLQGLTNLVELSIQQCQLSSISPLQNLTGIKFLTIGFNPQLADISAVQNMSSLSIFNARSCQIADISALQNKLLLSTIYIDSNRVTNLSPVAGLSALTFLDASDNLISSLPSLNSCTSLLTVDFSDNLIGSVAPLQGHPVLRSLNLRNNQITDISPLQTNTALRLLVLDNNQVSNLAPLAGINQLQTLYLYNNNLTTITPLITSNPNLIRLYILQGNTIPGSEINSFQTTHPSCQVL